MNEQTRFELRMKGAIVGTLAGIAIGMAAVFAYQATHGGGQINDSLDRRFGEIIAFLVGLLTKTGVEKIREGQRADDRQESDESRDA